MVEPRKEISSLHLLRTLGKETVLRKGQHGDESARTVGTVFEETHEAPNNSINVAGAFLKSFGSWIMYDSNAKAVPFVPKSDH
jgi:hypothetical protein